ncbi:putative transposase (TCE33) [Haloferax mediterranei ATCC 33500]|uniref:Transposase (TCE33) n=1 Tax=Haloferax mediterranei (strain ATCC 33500 / DSM 1411 / JCM 8866 / NBRC 14739 / NCIMB 2177 / R-4) TaxID=523841 RepID=I3RAW4_HALMT|nr:putative transposase (TCE33) [Haloferax mediterranei ATCC 33500]ELZ97303.1 putative transposase (TCE33) [Haloferax mediterranei ATCC 33500]
MRRISESYPTKLRRSVVGIVDDGRSKTSTDPSRGDFLAKTSSKDYCVRLFYFVFAVLLYNIWRLTDFLLKAGVDGEMDYAPVLTTGDCVEIVASALVPPD